MSTEKILMATDVPFWRNCSGAQQRMLHLVFGLQKNGFEVATFFIGAESETDSADADELGLDVRFHSSDQAPDGVRRRIKWHMEGTIHLVRQTFRGRKEQKAVDLPMKLTDFHWPWAVEAFAECVADFQPVTIIFQYITMGYLMDGLSDSERASIRCVVDTHDVLSERQSQFEQFGYSHWIDIGPHEEAAALQQFDAALAIIDFERPLLQSIAPKIEVLVASHSVEPIRVAMKDSNPTLQNSGGLTIGYFGSSNHSNGHALIKFVRNVWQPLRDSGHDLKLVIAGTICDWLMFHEESRFASDESMSLWIELSTDPSVTLLGRIESAAEFYSRIDVAINPVEFGTGLKIKTCEAFAWGIPSLVTSCGADAIPPESLEAVFVVPSIKDMIPVLVSMSQDQGQIRSMQEAASHIADSVFNDDVAYGNFCRWIRST